MTHPPRRTVHAAHISRLLIQAGFIRATTTASDYATTRPPITPGYKAWQRSSVVVLDYLPHDAEERADQLAAMAEVITSAGFAVAAPAARDGLEVRVPARTSA